MNPAVMVTLEPWQMGLLARVIGDAIAWRQLSAADDDWQLCGDYRVLAASLQVTPRRPKP